MRGSATRGGVGPARLTDEDRVVTCSQSPSGGLMSVVVAMAAFPVLAFLLMALSRAEESLSHVAERSPVRR
jgi:hypothetical protein